MCFFFIKICFPVFLCIINLFDFFYIKKINHDNANLFRHSDTESSSAFSESLD